MYLEKPLAHTIEEGWDVVKAWQKSGKIVQVGTQNRSSVLYKKAKELVDQGMIGDVHFVRAFWYRNGLPEEPVWRYVIPKEATPQNTDWNRFLGPAPKRPWDSSRYFQWRLYWDYSGGISTDLLVHQTDIVNFMLGKTVPRTCVASGGIYRWHDNRDVPDTFSALYEYPGDLQINYSSYYGNEHYGYGEQLFGNEGTIEVLDRQNLYFTPETFKGRAPANIKARQPIHLNGHKDFKEVGWRHQPLPQFHSGGTRQGAGDRAAAGGAAGGHLRPHGHAIVQEPEADRLGRSHQQVPLRVARNCAMRSA